ncbi:hypothetical protein DV711_11175 [Motiliproteus coralliicola]|uniref:Uncharacterized protein n=1 Tax=Motiliproteus coralliicola TaxID=2283196 RepID=A0A369WBQ8_9GAMM|nr:hypothetical protein [Motiliproteus coralliicola]RDE19448.1 hypothetical protein DV711_11175 [Motiliproteus coralliicola]
MDISQKMSPRQQATLSTLIRRFNQERLPRIQAMQVRVHQGELLGEIELQYLERVIRDLRRNQAKALGNPRFEALLSKVVALYVDVTDKALENERAFRQR